MRQTVISARCVGPRKKFYPVALVFYFKIEPRLKNENWKRKILVTLYSGHIELKYKYVHIYFHLLQAKIYIFSKLKY